MLFNTVDFAVFLPIVFAIYWWIPRRFGDARNVTLLAASYVFYGWWDYRFLSLILVSSLSDYWIGQRIATASSRNRRRLFLTISMIVNLGLLGFFKYFNFFTSSLAEAFTLFGMPLQFRGIDIVLPVGISFYTFQTMSYSIDVYRGAIEPSRRLVPFLAYVSFFPQLVAGPIERAAHLLPQFDERRNFNREGAVDGLRQILWGLFKKVVIADASAPFVNDIFDHHQDLSGSTLVLGAVLFAFQIYGDFSGYSDIAIGTARLFGFDLMRNFAYPYFSRDIAEFWRRWHISLSTWLRDYLYIPLGGSRGGLRRQVRNTFAIFLVSGLWHGANWTFVFWGFVHALCFLPLLLSNRNRRHLAPLARAPSAMELLRMLATFSIVVLAWVFFRAESISVAFSYLAGIFDPSILTMPSVLPLTVLGSICLLLAIEWFHRDQAHGLAHVWRLPLPLRWTGYVTIAYATFLLSSGPQTFIYFQF